MTDQIKWENKLSSSLKLATADNKAVLVDFFSPT